MNWIATTLIVITAPVLSVLVGWLVDESGQLLFGLPLLVTLALIAYGIQWLAFIPAYLNQTEHYYDLIGAMTYASLVLLALWAGEGHSRATLVAVLVGIWCARLGSFLFKRVRNVGKDGRFDEIKKDLNRFLVAWTIQGTWVFITLLAALIAMSDPVPASLDAWALVGGLIWLCGFGIEAIADHQKSAFKSDQTNSGQFIRTGLWAWSRHPNYFGEIVLWCGVCIIAVPAFEGWQWLGLLSPLFVLWLLMWISGIPPLERRADEKWGGQPDYEQYKAATPVLLLRPPR